LAKTPRTWTGARSPSGLKRVRSSARRHEILQPRRSAAKTLVKAALETAASSTNGESAESLAAAMSALDRAAKVGAIHPNQAARRKSRLALAMNRLSGTTTHAGTGAAAKTVSKAQAQKAAKARIAQSKADKAKGAQTAAGKARAALTRTSRAEAGTAAAPAATASAPSTASKPATKAPTAKAPAAKASAPKAAATKTASKTAPKTAAKATAKAPTAKATAKPAAKAAAKAPAKKAAK
jgi:ribosomal protein S20